MAQTRAILAGDLQDQAGSTAFGDHAMRVQPEFVTVVDARRKFVEVSPAFCKLLGYTQEELIGKAYDDITVPRTNDIPGVLEMFLKVGYMSGIWVLRHRRGTKLFVRYEWVLREDGLFQSRMELLAAGA